MQLTHSLYEAHGLSGHPVPGRLRSSWPARRLLAIMDRISAEREIRRAMRELQSFDDRMLSDIGIARGEIERTVRYGPAEPYS